MHLLVIHSWVNKIYHKGVTDSLYNIFVDKQSSTLQWTMATYKIHYYRLEMNNVESSGLENFSEWNKKWSGIYFRLLLLIMILIIFLPLELSVPLPNKFSHLYISPTSDKRLSLQPKNLHCWTLVVLQYMSYSKKLVASDLYNALTNFQNFSYTLIL